MVDTWLRAWRAEGINPKHSKAALKAAKEHPQIPVLISLTAGHLTAAFIQSALQRKLLQLTALSQPG